jgi:hypothetical protein
MAAKKLHPALVAHGQKVKAAHAHLTATKPGYAQLPMKQRMTHIQDHIRKTAR